MRNLLLIILGSFVLLLPFLGSVHLFDWDEINFAECAREMLVSGNYLNLQMNFHPFWEKPPLFIWMQVLSMKVFGVNEFAARFPNAVCGLLTFLVIFRIGQQIAGSRRAWLWVLCYAGSILPQFYFRSGIIDPWFNLFIFLSWYFYLRYDRQGQALKYLLYAAVCAGLALLTKGPAALVILGLSLFVLFSLRRFKDMLPFRHLLLGLMVVLLVGGLWFLLLLMNGHFDIIENFVSYQYHLFHAEDSGHGGPFFYHFVVLLLGCFPASVFAMPLLFTRKKTQDFEGQFSAGMRILFWVVLILFSVVQTKIVHYSSLCYFPLTWLAAEYLDGLIGGRLVWRKYLGALLLTVGGILCILFVGLPIAGINKTAIIQSGIIHDDNFTANLQASVRWSGLETAAGLLLLSGLVVFLMLKKSNIHAAVISVLLSVLLMVPLASILIIPRIEGYTQKSVIDFYESLRQKDCYAESLHYLSYAPYFYAQKMPPPMPEKVIRQWMLKGNIDKPCYFVCKAGSSGDVLRDFPDLRLLKSENGFVFYERLPKTNP